MKLVISYSFAVWSNENKYFCANKYKWVSITVHAAGATMYDIVFWPKGRNRP